MIEMKKLKIGQIIFFMNEDDATILTARVVEEVAKKTIQGTQIFYVVELLRKADTTPVLVPLDSIKGVPFFSKNDLKKEMVQRATSTIDSMIENVQKMITANKWEEDEASDTRESTSG